MKILSHENIFNPSLHPFNADDAYIGNFRMANLQNETVSMIGPQFLLNLDKVPSKYIQFGFGGCVCLTTFSRQLWGINACQKKDTLIICSSLLLTIFVKYKKLNTKFTK